MSVHVPGHDDEMYLTPRWLYCTLRDVKGNTWVHVEVQPVAIMHQGEVVGVRLECEILENYTNSRWNPEPVTDFTGLVRLPNSTQQYKLHMRFYTVHNIQAPLKFAYWGELVDPTTNQVVLEDKAGIMTGICRPYVTTMVHT